MPDADWYGYTVRAAVVNPHLEGVGMEIGAGANPHRLPASARALYFDKIDTTALTSLFGTEITYEVHPLSEFSTHMREPADFLIAHNVLEHLSNPIKGLMEWHGYVREGGVVVLSMPCKSYAAADTRRLTAPFRHIVEDFIFDRSDQSFESLEHVYGFCLNWDHARWTDSWRHLDRDQFIDHLLATPYAPTQDFHWHAVDRDTWDRVISSAAIFGNRGVELLTAVDPTSTGEWVTEGEAIYVYRLTDGGISGLTDARNELAAIGEELMRTGTRLSTVLSSDRT